MVDRKSESQTVKKGNRQAGWLEMSYEIRVVSRPADSQRIQDDPGINLDPRQIHRPQLPHPPHDLVITQPHRKGNVPDDRLGPRHIDSHFLQDRIGGGRSDGADGGLTLERFADEGGDEGGCCGGGGAGSDAYCGEADGTGR